MGIDTVVIGAGKMGGALLSGMLAGGVPASRLAVVTLGPVPDLGAVPVAGSLAELPALDPGWGALVAVKPGDVEAVVGDAVAHGATRILSVAAGLTLASLGRWAGGAAVLRAMPNTPAEVGAGASGLSAGAGAGPADLAWAEGLLGAVGAVVAVPEAQLDAVTGLSGSGPAYVYLVAEALVDAGVLVGLPRGTAQALATQTLLGAARMLEANGGDAVALRAAVTSPGGTTAAGLRALEDRAVRAAFTAAVVASAERAAALGS